MKSTFFQLLNTELSSGKKKHEKMVSNPAKTGRVGSQIWSDQHQTLQKLFSKLTSPVKKVGLKLESKGELMHPNAYPSFITIRLHFNPR